MKYYVAICFFWSRSNKPTVYLFTYAVDKNMDRADVEKRITIAAKDSIKTEIRGDIFQVHDVMEITKAEYNRA